ncbi:MAG TPA: DUF1761 domain-containing protein [Chryseosolibacter sp.]
MEFQINFLAVVVATIVSFIIGFVWYTPLFGKAWAKEMGFTMDRKPTSGELTKGMLLNLIGNFFMAYVFAHNNEAWSFVPGMDEMSMGAKIANAGIFTWLGFFVPQDLNKVAWGGRSWKLFFIDTGYHLVMLLAAAAILMLWQ